MLRSQRQGKSSKLPPAETTTPLSPDLSQAANSPTASHGWFSKPSKWFGSNPSSSVASGSKDREVTRKRSLDIKRTLAGGGSSSNSGRDRPVTPQPSIAHATNAPSSATSTKFFRRPTFSHHNPVQELVPPLPTARRTSAGQQTQQPTFVPLAHGEDESDVDEDGLPTPISNLSTASRKTWSRSVEDLSKLLGKSSGGGADGGSGGAGFWGQRRKGASELPSAMSPLTDDSQVVASSKDAQTRRPRRKTNSLAGHTLLASAAAAQQASRPHWAQEYDGAVRLKMSSPPNLGGGLKTSGSSPALSVLAKSPDTSSSQWNVGEIVGAANRSHRRSQSHSLLNINTAGGSGQSLVKDEPTTSHSMSTSPPSSSPDIVQLRTRSAGDAVTAVGLRPRVSSVATAIPTFTGNPAISNPILTPAQASHIERQGIALSPAAKRSESTSPSPLPSPGLFVPGSGSTTTSVTSFATPTTGHQHPSSFTSASSFNSPLTNHSNLSPLTTFEVKRDAKRASQVVVRSGFLLKHPIPAATSNSPSYAHGSFKPSPSPGLRAAADYFDTSFHANAPPTKGIDLSKGWKPYKVELKGSKLCFYKPPSDRRVAVESLFPIGPVPALKSPMPTDTSPEKKAGGNQGRKRAYWGSARHPDLILNATPLDIDDPIRSKVQAGSMEAFAHELVFCTCFELSPEPSEKDLQRFSTSHATFVDTVAFAHRRLTTTTKFAAEILRCVQMAKNASSSPNFSTLRQCALRIVKRLVESYGAEIQEEGQECRGALLEIVELVEGNADCHQDTQTILQALRGGPKEAPTQLGQTTDWSRMVSSAYCKPAFQRSISAGDLRMGISSAALLKMNPDDFAVTLHAFHLDALRIAKQTARLQDFLLAAKSQSDTRERVSLLSMFAFTASRPHFLTLLILKHIFPASQQSSAPPRPSESSGRTSSPALPLSIALSKVSVSDSAGPSPPHQRAAVIQKWIAIGEASRVSGDAAGFMAVAMAICSRSVARLTRTWRRISDTNRDLVSNVWAPRLSELGLCDTADAMILPLMLHCDEAGDQPVPYLGSLLDDLHRHAMLPDGTTAATLAGQCIPVGPLYSASLPAYRALHVLSLISDHPRQASEGAIIELAAAFQQLAFRGQSGFDHTVDFIASSLASEAPSLGTYAETFWRRKPPTGGPSPLLPLLWPEPLPTISLVDRDALVSAAREAISRNISSNNLASTARGPDRAASIGITSSGGKRLVRTRSLPSVRDSISENAQAATHNEENRQRQAFFGSMRGIESLGESLLRVADGELVLKIAQHSRLAISRGRSRPTSLIDSHPMSRQSSLGGSSSAHAIGSKRNSVTPSLREGSTSHRSSAPSSRRNSVMLADSLEPLRATVKSGSLDRLIDILVSGLMGDSSHADDSGLPGLGRRRFTVDVQEFRSAFFATYRSFCRPLLLFECLKKRFDQALDASTTNELSLSAFAQPSPSVEGHQVVSASAIRTGVLSAVDYWIREAQAAQDCLDHPDLYVAMLSFLDIHPAERPCTAGSEPFIDGYHELVSLAQKCRRLSSALRQQMLRPLFEANMKVTTTFSPDISSSAQSSQPTLPSFEVDIDAVSAADLVELLENVAATTYHKVSEMDLLSALELLEQQSTDKLGWYSVTSTNPFDDEVVIQDLYTHFDNSLGSTSSYVVGEDVPFVKKLPASLRTVFRAHVSIRRWLVMQIAGHGVGVELRTSRVKTMLAALCICRDRAHVADTVWTAPHSLPGFEAEPVMTTFVGRALTAALLSPESRAHAKVWQNVAEDKGGAVDDLYSLLPPQTQPSSQSNGCTIDPAWLLERMIEVICQVPDFVQDDQHLLNFDKRRYLCNLVRNAPTLVNFARCVTKVTEIHGVRTLTFLEQSLYGPQPDLRLVREEAFSEAVAVSKHQQTIRARPFQRLVHEQQDKTRRDKVMRERLLKEQRLERARVEKREKELNHIMKPTKPNRSGGSRVTAVFKSLYVRPMSIVTGAPHTTRGEPSPSRSAKQLDFELLAKPSLVLSIVGARAQLHLSLQRSHTFAVFAEDGAAPVLLQAANGLDADDWVASINRVGHNAAAQRLTFLANTTAPDFEPDQVLGGSNGTGVYGVPLESLLPGEAETFDNMAIPSVAELCMTAIEQRGLSEVGLYRIPGSISSINALRDSLNRGESVDLTEEGDFPDIHVVCGAFKLWLRQLPEPVFPTILYESLIGAAQIVAYEARLYAIRELIWTLPKPHFALLRRLMEHLDKVTDYEEHNQMPPSSLAIVFSPNLLKPPVEDGGFATSMTNLGHAANLIKSILLAYHWIFYDEVEADAEASSPATPVSGALHDGP